MKTIYDRLNPDILASINKDEQEYPYTTKAPVEAGYFSKSSFILAFISGLSLSYIVFINILSFFIRI